MYEFIVECVRYIGMVLKFGFLYYYLIINVIGRFVLVDVRLILVSLFLLI